MSSLKPVKPVFHGEITLADSSVIKAVKFDPDLGVLDVKLQSGKAYRYRNVWNYEFAKLLTAKSSGKIYNENIKRDPYSGPRKATRLRTW